MSNNPSVSLIITTYNWKEALELVLLSVKRQTFLPNEVIIADDGSKEDTKELIEKFQKDFPIPLIHSWQEDEGFRAAKSRNNAINLSKYEYIILIDGDMILDRNFVKDHLFFSKRNTFIQGSRALLTKEKTKDIFKSKNLKFNFFNKGILNKFNVIRCISLSKLVKKENKKQRGIKTCNMSFFKEDCIRVNGFNEDFVGWGKEDSEFVQRLYNTNIIRQNIKFASIAFHLYHKENSRKQLEENEELFYKTIQEKLKWCENGL